MQSVQMQLAKELAKECRTVEDIHNKLKELFKDSLQQPQRKQPILLMRLCARSFIGHTVDAAKKWAMPLRNWTTVFLS